MIVNFPIIKKNEKQKISVKNRGMSLEKMINESNNYYLNNNIAVIHKKPVPIQIVDVSYPARNKAEITKAYYITPSTTDYNGVYKGKYIDFEAKENHHKTLFPIKNVLNHQIEHLKKITEHGGYGFIIVYWSMYNEFYLLEFNVFYKYYQTSLKGEKKSISYQVFQEEAHLIKESYIPRLNYLKILDEKVF